MYAPKAPSVTSPQRVKNRASRVTSPYMQALAAWSPPGTGQGASKASSGAVKTPSEGYDSGGGTVGMEGRSIWKRALAVTGVRVGTTEGSPSPEQTGLSTPGLYSVVMKATQAQRGPGRASTSLNRSAKQYGTKEEMYLELQGLKKAVRLAANERDNLKSRFCGHNFCRIMMCLYTYTYITTDYGKLKKS